MNTIIDHQYQDFNRSSVTTTLSEIERGLLSQESKSYRTVFSVSIEALQNMSKHHEVPGTGSIKYSLQHDPKSFCIQTINAVKKNKVEDLKNKLDKINNSSVADLKVQYKKVLQHNPLSIEGNAGLGLIQMARKSKEKLTYEFVDLDGEYTSFQLIVTIKK